MENAILWMFAASLLFSLCTCRDHQQNQGVLNLDKNLNISWTIHPGKETIRFKVKTVIGETGWFLIGFEPQKRNAPKAVKETSADAFVVWRQIVNSGNNKTYTWNVTDCNTFQKGTLRKDKIQNYHLPKNLIKTMYDSKNKMLTAIVWRKLDTKNKEDVIIKGSMFIFGSFGNDAHPNKKWKHILHAIKNGMDDVFLKATNVSFFEVNSSNRNKGGRNFVKYAGKLAEQHWIGLVVGMSAFLTIIITCTVYCLAKKAGGIKKHVSMSFNKESEYDDEAKVAFLQSEET
ncbi:uncharacterized protein LOC116296061 isoform X2 [Actinia tenebrosa]|uniref:Uncharacterized protein LOC116296061 isoform X2 n=1 Tax=Actinia tenebrosa TaxID=6105 RepID=A0A6P8I536_ACTTE|nr:uncharacterized protein LOC116296061 isoform X2 [Actinia tenebrosa]